MTSVIYHIVLLQINLDKNSYLFNSLLFQGMEGRFVIQRCCIRWRFRNLDYFERRRRTRLGRSSKFCLRRQSITDFAQWRGLEAWFWHKVNFYPSKLSDDSCSRDFKFYLYTLQIFYDTTIFLIELSNLISRVLAHLKNSCTNLKLFFTEHRLSNFPKLLHISNLILIIKYVNNYYLSNYNIF